MSLAVIYTIGIGNSPGHITNQAKEILSGIDVVAGHFGFIEMAKPFINPKAMIIDDRPARNRAMTFEDYQKDRVSMVVSQALQKKSVAVLSGGDSGLWGMAGVFIEAKEVFGQQFDVKIIPGVSSITSIAAKLGAPLQNGFTIIAIGDEDVPFHIIEQRLEGAAFGGGVIVLYKLILENLAYPEFYPKDKYPELYPPDEKTKYRLKRTYDTLRRYIPENRVMVIVTDAFDQTSGYSKRIDLLGNETGKETIEITSFKEFLTKSDKFRFFTTVIIGDASTRIVENELVLSAQWNYKWKYSAEMLEKVNDLRYLFSYDEFFNK